MTISSMNATIRITVSTIILLALSSPLAASERAAAALAATETTDTPDGIVSVETLPIAPKPIGCPPLLLHFSLGGSFALEDDLALDGLGESGVTSTVGGDIVLGEQLAASLLGGIVFLTEGDRGNLRDLFVGAGFRMFFRTGSLALTEEGGSAIGIAWVDAHLAYHRYKGENHMGIDVGVGYDFTLGRELNLGPAVRIQFTPFGDGLHYALMTIGLRVSLGGKMGLLDRDGDSIDSTSDLCPFKRETRNGYKDEDGCPDTRQ